MSNPLMALNKKYYQMVAEAKAMPHFGLPGVQRGVFDRALLPAPDLAEINTRTKEPHVFCVELPDADGRKELIMLKSPSSRTQSELLMHDLIGKGLHPMDIVIATLDMNTLETSEPRWIFRTVLDHLLWTVDDQRRLDALQEPVL